MWRHKIVADGSSEFNGPNLFSSFSTPDVLGIWTLLSHHVSYDPSDDILLCSLRCALKSKKGRLSNVLERYSPITASGEYFLFLAYLLAHTGLSYASILSIYSTGRACDHYLFLSIALSSSTVATCPGLKPSAIHQLSLSTHARGDDVRMSLCHAAA
jgi:hypothetical protein